MCAGDEAYALSTSLVGSIGVLVTSFGFQGALGKLGVERRVVSAGGPQRPAAETAPACLLGCSPHPPVARWAGRVLVNEGVHGGLL